MNTTATAMSEPDPVDCDDPNWLSTAVANVAHYGFQVVTGVLPASFVATARQRMYEVRNQIVAAVGADRLERAGENGVLRLMATFDPFFLSFLEIPEMNALIDTLLGAGAILHVQNGLLLPPSQDQQRVLFQNSFHRDFPRVLNGYFASLNTLFAIDAFSEVNGATIVVARSHQQIEAPDPKELQAKSRPIVCPSGSMVVFDSTLWHAAGLNRSPEDRLAVNHQFTRAFFKQQIDYVRALGHQTVMAQPIRTQQLLGWHSRVPTCLDDYYVPEDQRLYRRGQG